MININNFQPIPTIFVIGLIPTLLFWTFSKTRLKKIIFLLFLLLATFYFGPIALLKTTLFFVSAFVIGKKIFKNNNLASLILGILTIIQTHIVLSLIIGTENSQNILYVVETVFILYQRKLINKDLYTNIQLTINSLNIVEIFLISFAFVISSQPQVYWDAVHANLYNAKWYFQNNSLSPLTESISSLFPQNGIVFFSYFYGLGGNKILQIAYLLPLILTIFILKKIKLEVKNRSFFNLASLLLISTPIFIFESSTGYSDSLVTLCCLTTIYLLLNKTTSKEIVSSAFIIGFSAAVKYFPIVLGLIPIFFIFKNKDTFLKKIKLILITLILVTFPLLIWGTRSYITTKNPFFPFAQYIFPTPSFWSPSVILENNFMIKTSMLPKEWLLGGFIYYPIQTYINSEKFMEAINGYTTITPMILNFIALIIILYLIIRLIRHKLINNSEYLLILFYLSLIIIGLASRYYRYLWPYQTIIFVLTIYLISQKINKNIILNFLLVGLFLSNLKNTHDQLRYYPLYNNRLFNPNYFQENYKNNEPISFLNKNIKTTDNVLDASKYLLPRVHLNSKVTQCNWYWIMGQDKITKKDALLNFKFIVLSTDKSYNNYCTNTINKYREKFTKVFENQDYLILKP